MSTPEPLRAPLDSRLVRVPKMAELVAGQLRRQIVRGTLAEGTSLPSENTLMGQFQVSRPTLREAFRVLESESLITVRRGARGGARVQAPSVAVAARYVGLILQHRGTSLVDVLEVRTVVEPQAVARLAVRRTVDELARLRMCVEEPGETAAETWADSVRRLERFHALLLELVGNTTLAVLLGMIEQIVELADRTRIRSDAGTEDAETAIRRSERAHRKLVELIEQRDADGAEQVWRRHLRSAQEYLVRGSHTTVLDLLE